MVDSPERPRRNAANQEYQTLTTSCPPKYAHAGRYAGQIPLAVRDDLLVQRFPLHSNVSPILASLKNLGTALLRCSDAGVSISMSPYAYQVYWILWLPVFLVSMRALATSSGVLYTLLNVSIHSASLTRLPSM